MSILQMPTLAADLKAALQLHFDALKDAHQTAFFIKQCRVKQMSTGETKLDRALIWYAIAPTQPQAADLDNLVFKALNSLGCVVKHGMAPPSPVERKLQADIKFVRALSRKK